MTEQETTLVQRWLASDATPKSEEYIRRALPDVLGRTPTPDETATVLLDVAASDYVPDAGKLGLDAPVKQPMGYGILLGPNGLAVQVPIYADDTEQALIDRVERIVAELLADDQE